MPLVSKIVAERMMVESVNSAANKSSNRPRSGIKIGEHIWAAAGLLFGVVLLIPDVRSDKFSVLGAFGLVAAIVFFFVDVVLSSESDNNKISKSLEDVESSVLNKLSEVGSAVSDNTHTLRQHQQLLVSRTTDKLTLIAFRNLLAYLPFYLAEDLGYLHDEKVAITTFTASLDDQNTARLLQENPSGAIAICDPYMCVSHPDLRLVYPICNGVAAWPMTLNWIGSTAASKSQVQIAAYKAPSTTHVLAQFVKRNVIVPLLPAASGITVSVVELKDEEADFGESDRREEVSRHLEEVLMKYDVVMLWEPHCELAVSLGARYLERNEYEARVSELGSPLYSGLVLSDKMIYRNPTLPIRLRRGLDRAVARLQDPDRLSYCTPTLIQRRLLNGFSSSVQKSVLARLVESVPKPIGSGEFKSAGWENAAGPWAAGISAADNLRKALVKNNPALRTQLQLSTRSLTSTDEFRSLIYIREQDEA
jgi:hypothetical protein